MPTLTGTPGNDYILGTAGDDLIDGLGGNDTLFGKDGNDEIRGGEGDDYITGDAGNDILDGGAGNDAIEGGLGRDMIYGAAGDDELRGGGFLSPNEAGELIDGGGGIDFLTFVANSSSLDIVFSIANPAVDQSVDGVTIRNVESIHFTASGGNDTLTGGAYRDIFYGEGGNDLIQGLGGDDSLNGHNGDDDLRGGDGDDSLRGDFGDDIVDGGAGNDTLDGGPGTNMIYGGAGDDSLRSVLHEAGELVDGGDGVDLLTFSTMAGGDIVFSVADPSIDQVVDSVTIRNIERVDFTAFDGNDTLTGGAYADTFLGGFGNDVIHGGGGNDILKGDSGTDQLFGDGGDDALTYEDADTLLDGGAGVDLANISLLNGGTAVTLDVSNPSVDQNVAGTIIRGIDRLNYTGGDAGNQITGGNYDDFIAGGTAADILDGGGGNDTLSGSAGIDQLSGGAGDDFLHSFETADTAGDSLLDGGDGFDLLELNIQNYSGATTIDLAATSGRIRNFEQINFSGGAGINIVTGGGAADTIRGNASADELRGLGGDDVLFGGGGGDLLYGGDGGDEIDGDAGADTIYGEAGNDFLRDYGAEGNFIDGGAGNDGITGGFGADTLIGGEGNDFIDGGAGADSMTGGIGNDHYFIDDAGDVATELAGEGIDEIHTTLASYTLGGTFENLSGNSSTAAPASGQTLTGNGFDNVITGGWGGDRLHGGGGNDKMFGGHGDDTFFVDLGDTVFEAAFSGYDGSDRVVTNVSYTLGAGQEIETLTTYGSATTNAVNLTGNEFANTIVGNAAANLIDGKGAADAMYGYAGNDAYYVDNAADTVAEAAGGGSDRVITNASYALAAGQHIEMLTTYGSATTVAVNLTGNEFANTLVGNAASNVLNGKGGIDVMYGYAGNDTYYVDHGSDSVSEALGGGSDTVVANVSYTLAAGREVEKLTTYGSATTAAINLTGNEFANTLAGNAAANVLNGKGAADAMYGYAGNDTYYVDNGADTVAEAAGGGSDWVITNVSYTLGAGQHIEKLTTYGSATTNPVNLTGSAFANLIAGNAAANVLDGKSGADALYGYGGADTFAFTTALGGGNFDTIADFAPGTDKIALDDAIFAAVGAALGASEFRIGAAAADADDRIIYNNANGQLLYDADGVGGAAAVLFATLNGAPAISASDFAVI